MNQEIKDSFISEGNIANDMLGFIVSKIQKELENRKNDKFI